MDKENSTNIKLNCAELEASSYSAFDNVQICWQLLASAVGIPLNLAVLGRLFLAERRPISENRIFMLYMLLSLSNIAILLVYCVGFSIWQLTFWWYAPDWVCKAYKFLDTCVFYLSSNATVSIAVDLFFSIRFPMATHINGARRVKSLIVGSVVLCVLSSFPQLFLWGIVDAECIDGTHREQCIFLYDTNSEALVIYSLLHNLVLFWIPIFIITPCYIRATMEAFAHYATGHPRNIPAGSLLGMAKQQHRSSKEILLKLIRRRRDVMKRKNALVVSCSNADSTIEKKLSAMILRKTFGRGDADQSGVSVRKKRARVLTSSLLIVTAYIVSWLPYQISSVYELCVDESRFDTELGRYLKCLEGLIIVNTLINPFLYRSTSTVPRGRGSSGRLGQVIVVANSPILVAPVCGNGSAVSAGTAVDSGLSTGHRESMSDSRSVSPQPGCASLQVPAVPIFAKNEDASKKAQNLAVVEQMHKESPLSESFGSGVSITFDDILNQINELEESSFL